VAAGAIGSCATSDCATEAIRRGTAIKAPGEQPLSAAADANRLDDRARDGDQGVILDLRVNPPENAARIAALRSAEGAVEVGSRHGGAAARPDRSAEASRPANPDTPFRPRSANQIYQAVEAADATVAHRGGIYDLQI